MANCCICGNQSNKSGSKHSSLGPLANYVVCDTCYAGIKNLQNNTNVEGSAKYFENLIPQVADGHVRACLLKIIEGHYTPELIAAKREAEYVAGQALLLNAKNMMITSSNNFEGWKILSYNGFISEEIVVGMGAIKSIGAALSNIAGSESEGLRQKLAQPKQEVMKRFALQAARLGANAIIATNLEYTMFSDTLVGIIVSGTAVVIGKGSPQVGVPI